MDKRRSVGFTLIELVIVIVLLAIVATISVQFVAYSTQGALDTASRQQRALAAAVISEQLSRALRQALPTSVRTFDNGHCIEWFPIMGASTYVTLPSNASPTTFDIVPFKDSSARTGRVVVYPHSGNVYAGTNPGPLSPTGTVAGGNVTLIAQHRFALTSPEKRFYLVGDPLSVCQVGRRLFRYDGYGVHENADTGHLANGKILADNLTVNAGTAEELMVFTISPATLERNAVVHFSFRLGESSGEVLNVDQEVQIRNVP